MQISFRKHIWLLENFKHKKMNMARNVAFNYSARQFQYFMTNVIRMKRCVSFRQNSFEHYPNVQCTQHVICSNVHCTVYTHYMKFGECNSLAFVHIQRIDWLIFFLSSWMSFITHSAITVHCSHKHSVILNCKLSQFVLQHSELKTYFDGLVHLSNQQLRIGLWWFYVIEMILNPLHMSASHVAKFTISRFIWYFVCSNGTICSILIIVSFLIDIPTISYDTKSIVKCKIFLLNVKNKNENLTTLSLCSFAHWVRVRHETRALFVSSMAIESFHVCVDGISSLNRNESKKYIFLLFWDAVIDCKWEQINAQTFGSKLVAQINTIDRKSWSKLQTKFPIYCWVPQTLENKLKWWNSMTITTRMRKTAFFQDSLWFATEY